MGKIEQTSFAAFAGRLADAARLVTVAACPAARAAENKGAAERFDPVTVADRQAELAMRALIEAQYPDHGIEGEEFPNKEASGRHIWTLDPIDGTRAFICGLPSWTTLIGLIAGGEPILGLIDAPALNERYLGTEGSARMITTGGSRLLSTSPCINLAEARLSTTDPYLFEAGEFDAFEHLRRAVRLTRFGYDAYAYARLASGDIDLVAESGLKPHDFWPLVQVIRGAGGVIGNWSGGADLSGGDVLAAATRQLFDQAVGKLTR